MLSGERHVWFDVKWAACGCREKCMSQAATTSVMTSSPLTACSCGEERRSHSVGSTPMGGVVGQEPSERFITLCLVESPHVFHCLMIKICPPTPLSMQIKQLEADLVELESLLEKAERKRVQDLLKQEKQKVEKELVLKKQQKEQQVKRAADPSAPSKAPYTVKITNYGMGTLFRSRFSHLCRSATVNIFATIVYFTAWDQSEKFVKIYLTLKDVHKNPSENVEVEFKEG